MVQVNEIYNHYVENSPYIFVDERSPIPLNDHVNMLAKVRSMGSVFLVACNPENQREVWGWHS